MEKEINFTGLNLTPYSDISPDGQLSVAEGIERHAGSIRPVTLQGKVIVEDMLTDYDTLLCLHSTSSYQHFIILTERPHEGKQLYYIPIPKEEGEEKRFIQFYYLEDGMKIQQVSTLGNTFILITTAGIHYFLFKNNDYKHLGTKPPELDMSFGLIGSVRTDSEQTIDCSSGNTIVNPSEPEDTIIIPFDESAEVQVSAQVNAYLNEFIGEQESIGGFLFPFFIRYAYRTYSGHYMVSSPVLLIPNEGRWPQMIVSGLKLKQDTVILESFQTALTTAICYPFYTIDNFDSKYNELQKWKDIIESVDIFISKPISPYITNGTCKRIVTVSDRMAYWKAGYRWISDSNRELFYKVAPEYYLATRELDCANIGNEEYVNRIKSTGNYYKALSIPISELKESLGKDGVPMFKGNVIQNITAQDSLKTVGSYDHDELFAGTSYAYNQRLNLANMKRKPYMFPIKSLSTYTNSTDGLSETTYSYRTYVVIENNGSYITVKGSVSQLYALPKFVFYPNPKAKKIVVEKIISDTQSEWAEYLLTEHLFDNGAYYYGEPPAFSSNYDTTQLNTEDDVIYEPNKIYTSEVNNPFYFPLNGINTIGTGTILGLASITTPLSQGQFGQFTLMAFCTDGNYALQVNDEGLYAGTPPPMQRDVCTNPDSITQIAGEVIFVSARGAMSADGSIIKCISEALNGVPEDTGKMLPTDLFQQCRVAYDYAGRRIIFFSTTNDESYVLSLEDGTWSNGNFGQIKTVLNVYPYSYIQLAVRGTIIQLNAPYQYNGDTGLHTGRVVTRPLKLDSLQLKRLHQFKLEGIFKEPQQIKIFGSQNGTDWQLIGGTTRRRVGNMCGRYYKYYRFEIITSLGETENISGIRLEYDVRPESRMR